MPVPSLYSLVGQIVSNSQLQNLYQYPNIPCQYVQINNRTLILNNEIYLSNSCSTVIAGTINQIYRNKNNTHIKLKYVEQFTNEGRNMHCPNSLTMSAKEIRTNWVIN